MVAGHDVVDLKKSCSFAPGRLATMLISTQDLPADAWRNGGRIPAAWPANSGVAPHPMAFGPTEFAFSGTGLDCHPICMVLNMDLDRGPASEGPPRFLFRSQVHLEAHRQFLGRHDGWCTGQQLTLPRVHLGGLFDPFHFANQFLARPLGSSQPVVLSFGGGHAGDFPGFRVSEVTRRHGLTHSGQPVKLPRQTNEIARPGFGKTQLFHGVLVDGRTTEFAVEMAPHDLGEPQRRTFLGVIQGLQ